MGETAVVVCLDILTFSSTTSRPSVQAMGLSKHARSRGFSLFRVCMYACMVTTNRRYEQQTTECQPRYAKRRASSRTPSKFALFIPPPSSRLMSNDLAPFLTRFSLPPPAPLPRQDRLYSRVRFPLEGKVRTASTIESAGAWGFHPGRRPLAA